VQLSLLGESADEAFDALDVLGSGEERAGGG